MQGSQVIAKVCSEIRGGATKGEESHNGEEQNQMFAAPKFLLAVQFNWPAQIEMITSGKSDEGKNHSNKIKIFMHLKKSVVGIDTFFLI